MIGTCPPMIDGCTDECELSVLAIRSKSLSDDGVVFEGTLIEEPVGARGPEFGEYLVVRAASLSRLTRCCSG